MSNIKKFSSRKEVTEFLATKGIDISNWSEEKWLKLNKGQAEIHMMALAECIWDAMNESTPEQLISGMWHIPFMSRIDSSKLLGKTGEEITKEMVKISTAMAARTSYTVVGDEKEVSYEKLLSIHDKMLNAKPFHASPFEHCARAMSNEEYVSFIKSIHSTSNKVEKTDQGGLRQGQVIVNDFIVNREEHYGWCRNYRGFIQYRHILET